MTGAIVADDSRARDGETGLYNETFMREMLARLFKLYDRENAPGVSVFLFQAEVPADRVGASDDGTIRLRVARVLGSATRGSDIPVYLDHNVFAVFLLGARPDMLQSVAERIGAEIRQSRQDAGLAEHPPVLRGGIAMRRQRETLESLLARARSAMAEAAAAGRNHIRAAVEYFPV